jgi:hypothetical protein
VERRARAHDAFRRRDWRTAYGAFRACDGGEDLERRFGDETLVALGTFFEGRVQVKRGNVRDGVALLDEAMLAALSDRLKPMWTGAIYCGLLDACHELVDVRRAREWTEATRRWCAPLPGAVAAQLRDRRQALLRLHRQGRGHGPRARRVRWVPGERGQPGDHDHRPDDGRVTDRRAP